MKPWRRPWPVRILVQLLELVHGPAVPVVDNSLARTKRLQRQAAREANRTPFIPTTRPRLSRGLEDRGFQ